MMKTIVLLAVVSFLPALPASAHYVPPDYPQTSPAVAGISIDAPATAEIGSTVKLFIGLTIGPSIAGGRKLYAQLRNDGKAYHVQVIDAPSGDWEPGKTTIGPIALEIPGGLDPGEYELRVGVYGEPVAASRPIRLTGERPSKPPLIVTTGTFIDKYGTPHHWHINKAHTLIWDGAPFIPAGGMFIYDRDWNLVKAQLDLLRRYGVKNIYLHLGVNQPYVWKDYSDDDYRFFQQTIDYLDDNGFTYGIEFQAFEANGPGYSYPGGGIGVDHVKANGIVRAEAKEPRSGVFIVADNATGAVVQTGTARVVDGKFLEADVVVPKAGDYRVVFAADRAGPDGFVMYYWDDKYQAYVNKVRSHYSKVKLGPGFRFFVDPLWNEMNTNHSLIPSAPAFAEQFTAWLRQRYGSIDRLNEAWAPVGVGWPTFSAAGSTISVERIGLKDLSALGRDLKSRPNERFRPSGGRLMQYCYSRSAKRFYTIDACASQFNYDVREFIGRSLLHYCNDIANVVKQMNDVPVIYKAFSDVDWWHINDSGLASGHDGLGMESYGNGEPMLMFMGAHVFGECEQAAKTTWLIVTETGEGNHQDAALERNKPIGYTDRLDTMYANFNALISGGAKGIYQFNMIGGRGVQEPWSDNISRDPRQLEWLATYDSILANASALADYKPCVYYRFPAQFNPNSMELYSEPCGDFYNFGGWWWREPVERSQNGLWILPSFSLRPETPMFIVNLEKAPASVRFASELTAAVERGERITMIGFRYDLGTIPAVDSYYTDGFSINERGRRFQVLRPTPTSRILNATADGKVWNLIDGKLQVNSEQVFGRHGYSPENLAAGPERAVDPYRGVFDLLRVKVVQDSDRACAFFYEDQGVPVTVVSVRSRALTFAVPKAEAPDCRYPDGTPAGVTDGDDIVIDLTPVNRELVKARHEWAPDGVLVDSLSARDTVIIRGGEVPGHVATTDGVKPQERDAQRVWIEGEKPVSHNFNYSWLGGVPTLSGNGFLALETAVTPPLDTGWYASYEFETPRPATYEMWVRESYLSDSSPCSYRLDNGRWVDIPNSLVPEDTRVISQYNAVEDTRQIFDWYCYGAVQVSAGKHILTLRVDKPRPKGGVITMADDRPYAKQIDCIVLTPADEGQQVPEEPGAGLQIQPRRWTSPQRYTQSQRWLPRINRLPNPSVEFDSNGDGKCDGWTASDTEGLEWTRPCWGNLRVEGLFDINLGRRESYAGARSLRIAAGETDRQWSSDSLPAPETAEVSVSGWVRCDGGALARLVVDWLDSAGRLIASDAVSCDPCGPRWHEVRGEVRRPDSAVRVVLRCVTPAGSSGTAWFDDLVLTEQ